MHIGADLRGNSLRKGEMSMDDKAENQLPKQKEIPAFMKLEGLLKERDEQRRQQAETDSAIQGLQRQLATDQCLKVLNQIERFIKLFRSGVVAKAFAEVQESLATLEQYDPSYLKEMATSHPYGKVDAGSDKQYRYLVGQVLGSRYFEKGLWPLLVKLGESIDREGNPFHAGE